MEENHLGLFWQALDVLTGFKYIETPTHIFDACLALLLLRLCCSHPPYYDLTDCLDTDPVCHAAYANAESRFNDALTFERPIKPLHDYLGRRDSDGCNGKDYQNVCTVIDIDTLGMDIDTFRLI